MVSTEEYTINSRHSEAVARSLTKHITHITNLRNEAAAHRRALRDAEAILRDTDVREKIVSAVTVGRQCLDKICDGYLADYRDAMTEAAAELGRLRQQIEVMQVQNRTQSIIRQELEDSLQRIPRFIRKIFRA